MPEIQVINEFKNDLIRLGNEPEIREQRGEALPNITVPESESVEDLSALFDEDDTVDIDAQEETDLFAEDGAEEDDFNAPADLTNGFDEDIFGEADALPEVDEPADEDVDFSTDSAEDLLEGDLEGFYQAETESSGFETPADDVIDLDTDELDTADFDTEEGDDALDGTDEFDIADFDAEGDDAPDGADEFDIEDFDAVEGGDAPDGAGEFDTADFDAPDSADAFDIEDFDTVEGGDAPDSADAFDIEEFDTVESGDAPDSADEFDIEDFDAVEGGDAPDGIDEFDIEDFDAVEGGDALDSPDEFDTADFDTSESDTSGDLDSMDFSTDELDAAAEISEDLDSVDFSTDELDTADFGTAGVDDEIEDFDIDDSSEDEETGSGDDFSLEDFSLEEIDGDEIEASEFSLGDLGQEFGIDDEEESDVGQLESLGGSPLEDSGGDFGDAYSDDNYAIPDDEYVELKKTLGRMPRNLKLVIEELIGEKNLTGDNLDKLLQALIAGKSAKEVGAVVSKITGKKIKIPTQYERRTAEEFEKEKDSFGYIFRKNFIPMFRAAAISAVILGLVLFLGYKFVYTPLHAESLYRKGYEEITLGNNEQANNLFSRAFSEWQKKSWFYDYAQAFTEQKQYILAEEKYEQLLSWYPQEREAVLDYAELEYKILGKYQEAETLLDDYLFNNLRDYDARLMLGDTYMEWAREIDPQKYEDARFNYAKLIELYGSRDEILFRMMRYFIRADNHTEAMNLYNAFKQNSKADIEPDIYAELAGYLIDNGQLQDVRDILMKAKSIREDLPEIHYELARYFNIIEIPHEEAKALQAAIWLYENINPLTRTRNGQLIDAYNKYGMVLFNDEMYLDAEDYYQKAAMNYDEALAAGQIQPEEKYGNIFSNLGDLAYYISGDYDQALEYFKKAEANEYSPEILKYKKGYIYYSKEDFRGALVEFYDTAGGFSADQALLYSTANTLFNRNDYYLAEGYYTHLLDLLDKEYSSINYLLIDEIPEHRALLENLIKVNNNLGVTKYRLYERSRDPEKNAEAMVLLTDSVEFYDKLTRDPNSLIEPDTVNLSYLNSKAVFYPVPDYRLQIYQDIPKDLSRLNF